VAFDVSSVPLSETANPADIPSLKATVDAVETLSKMSLAPEAIIPMDQSPQMH